MEDERLLDTLSKSCYASKSYSFLRGEKASELGVSIKRGVLVGAKALAIAIRTIAIAIAIEVKKSIEYCNMQ